MTVRVRPLKDWILVQYDPKEDTDKTSSGGIVLPGSAVEDVNQWGTVLAVGTGVVTKKGVRRPLQVEEGDRVLYIRYLKETHTGQTLRRQSCIGNNQFLIREGDILAIEKGKESSSELSC